jgi:hypothetical protein
MNNIVYCDALFWFALILVLCINGVIIKELNLESFRLVAFVSIDSFGAFISILFLVECNTNNRMNTVT